MAETGAEVTKLVSREEIPEDLLEAYLEQRKLAIRGLVMGETPEDVIATRPGRGRQTFRYVPVAWFIQQLNLVFMHRWDFEIMEHAVLDKIKEIWVKGKLTVTGADGVVITKTQFGGSAIKYNQEGTKIIDLADDLKSASSDCLKKCATLLGFAWDVYSGSREKLTEAGPSTSQLLAFYKRGEQAGLSKDASDDWFTKQTNINKRGIKPEEAVAAEIMGAIPLLIKLAKEKNGNSGAN